MESALPQFAQYLFGFDSMSRKTVIHYFMGHNFAFLFSDFVIIFTSNTSDNFFTTELQPKTTGAPLFSFKLRTNQQLTKTQWKAKATQKNLLTGIH